MASERLLVGEPFPETRLGAVQKYTEVITVDVELAAHLVLVPAFEEEPPKNVLFLWCQFRQRGAHAAALLFGHYHPIRTRLPLVRLVVLVRERRCSRSRPVELEQHVVTNRVDECPK